jgi:hypothetical protein
MKGNEKIPAQIPDVSVPNRKTIHTNINRHGKHGTYW